jgi:predicted nucleotidyltransferase
MRMSWPKQAVERLELLKKLREFSLIVAKAAKEILRDGLKAVYVVGSIAEGKATVYSDIDIAIVVNSVEFKNIDIAIDIKLKAEELGLPIDTPIDIKIITEDEFRSYLGKIYRKAIEIQIM